ncbi:hypothetical protein D3C72_2172970 [compost metagenome]
MDRPSATDNTVTARMPMMMEPCTRRYSSATMMKKPRMASSTFGSCRLPSVTSVAG